MLANVLGINWATPFILLSLYGAARYFLRGEDNEKHTVNWTPIESVGITLFIYFASQIIGGLIVYVIPMFSGWSLQKTTDWLDQNAVGRFVFILIIETLAIFLLHYFIKRRGANFRTIGLKKPHWRDLGYVLAGWAVYFVGYLVILEIIDRFVYKVNTDQQQALGFSGANGWQLPFVFIALVILPPITEELLVRGFLYSGLRNKLHIIWAALITSALFAAAHLQAGNGNKLLWSAAIDTFVLSFVLIYIKEKTGSLAACIGLHMLKNGIAFLGLFVLHIV